MNSRVEYPVGQSFDALSQKIEHFKFDILAETSYTRKMVFSCPHYAKVRIDKLKINRPYRPQLLTYDMIKQYWRRSWKSMARHFMFLINTTGCCDMISQGRASVNTSTIFIYRELLHLLLTSEVHLRSLYELPQSI